MRCFISSRVVAEGEDALLPALADAAFLFGHFHEDVQVAEGVVLDIRGGKAFQAALHAVGEDADDAQHLGTGLPKGLDYVDGATAGGDKIFNHNDFRSRVHLTLDPVRPAMALSFAPDITHRQVQNGGRDGGVSDARGGSAHEHLAIGVIPLHKQGKAVLHLLPHARRGKCETVVTINRALNAAGPGKGLLGPQEHGSDREKRGCDLTFHNAIYSGKRTGFSGCICPE